MSIIDRVRTLALTKLSSEVNARTKGLVPDVLGGNLGGYIAKGITQGPKALIASLPSAKAISGEILTGQVGNLLANASVQNLAQNARQAAQLALQQSGLPASLSPLLNLPLPGGFQQAAPAGPQWTAAPVFGGLSLEQYRELFVQSAMTAHAFKNLWHIRIAEKKRSKESPGGADGFNLFAVDCSFGPCTMPGEAIQLGAGNMDKLAATDRVELRVTTLDDKRGSIKRWFIAKCDQAANISGLFGLPSDYLLTIEVTHMAPTNEATKETHMRHKWLMRPVSIDIELSRRAPELEELSLSFTQFDTFVEA